MAEGSGGTRLLEALRRRLHAPAGMLACVYTCEAHRDLLPRFHASPIGQRLAATPGTRVLEVYASDELERSRLDGRQLLLATPEAYPRLALKTYRMIDFCVRNFRFDSLLKIDVTTVLTQGELGTPEFADRSALDLEALAAFIGGISPTRDYDGFIRHERAPREGAENWARKKGLVVDYARLFGDGPLPPFYSGKCYALSHRFAAFIAAQGEPMALEHDRYFPSEDVMVGRLHQRFAQARPA